MQDFNLPLWVLLVIFVMTLLLDVASHDLFLVTWLCLQVEKERDSNLFEISAVSIRITHSVLNFLVGRPETLTVAEVDCVAGSILMPCRKDL